MKYPKFNVEMAVAPVKFIRELKSKCDELSFITNDMEVLQAHLRSLIKKHYRNVPNTSHYQLDIIPREEGGLKITFNGLAVIVISLPHLECYTTPKKEVFTYR